MASALSLYGSTNSRGVFTSFLRMVAAQAEGKVLVTLPETPQLLSSATLALLAPHTSFATSPHQEA